jgi:tRNA A-37 threonylcarbamoyl transferase component Bud32
MPEVSAHPSAQALALFGHGKLSQAQTATVAAHLETCAGCRQAVASLPPDSFLGKVQAAKPGGTVLPANAPKLKAVAAAPVPGVPPELANHPKFRILRELGKGGMGVIYLAEHRVMEKQVALKVISPAVLDNPDALARFQAEVRAAGKLDHQNIARAYDADQAGELHFLVMEYVEGQSLAQLLERKGPLPVASACHCACQAALGLQHAFEKGMVHRDIKPQNLMLTPKGQVKVLDFGLARMRSERTASPRLTQLESFMGTPEYVSPEQATDARSADIRADIYSLGCTLYALLTGRSPFREDTMVKLVLAHIEKEPRPLHELRPDVQAELSAVVAKMLAKDPAQRFQRPVEAAQALAPFIKKAKSPEHRDPAPAELAIAPNPFAFITDVAPVPRRGPGLRATNHGRTVLLKETPARFRGRRLFVIAISVLFLLAGLLGAAVYRIATDQGELVIETDNDDVEVVVSKGGQVVKILDTKSGQHVTLNSGDYELALKKGQEGLKLSPGKVTLKRGETELATIRRVKPGEPPLAGKPPDGVVAWWRADRNAKDSVGNKHGTLKGGVTFAPGIAGQAFRLDGTTSYVEVPRSDLWGFGRQDFSIEFCVQFCGVTPSHNLRMPSAIFLGCSEGPGDRNKWWFAYADGVLNFLVRRPPQPDREIPILARTPFSPDLDQWYHLAVTRSRDTFTIYVDGVPGASEQVAVVIPNTDAP